MPVWFGKQTGIGRGIFAGGIGGSNIIDYVSISSAGNAVDFGDLTTGAVNPEGGASSTRGIFAGGDSEDTIQYITVATLGNSIDFGILSSGRSGCGGMFNSTRGIFAGGSPS